MPATSEARVLANRQNSLRSTGPKTPEGKEQSRRNGLKHGLTGSGVVVDDRDAPEVDRLASALMAELGPKSTLGRKMVARMATLSVRMERGARQESAAMARRVRHAVEDFDRRRIDMAEFYFDAIAEDPRGHMIELRRSPEGVDRLVEAWQALRATLPEVGTIRWGQPQHERLAHLAGLRPDEAIGSRPNSLSDAVRCQFARFAEPEWAGLDHDGRRAWARARLVEWIDERIAELQGHRATFDPEAIALDRLDAPDVALFDPSREATLARRYESEASRGFFKALNELRRAEAEAEVAADRSEPAPTVEPAAVATPAPLDPPGPLASSRDEPMSAPRQPEPAPDREPFWPPYLYDGVARGLDGRVLAIGRAVVVPR